MEGYPNLNMDLMGMASLNVKNMDLGMEGDPKVNTSLVTMRGQASMDLVMGADKNRSTGLCMREHRVRNMDLGMAGDRTLNMGLVGMANLKLKNMDLGMEGDPKVRPLNMGLDMRSQLSMGRVMVGNPKLNMGLGMRSPANMEGLQNMDLGMGGGQDPKMKEMGQSMGGRRVVGKREKAMGEGADMRSQFIEMIHLRGLVMGDRREEESLGGLLMEVVVVMMTTRIVVVSIVMVAKRAMAARNI